MNSIKEWLNAIGHGEYFQRFADSKINMDVLPDLREEDLEKLDIPLGDRKRIMRAISALVAQPADGAEPTAFSPPGLLTEGPSSDIAEPGQLRHLTVCFIDLVGSTALSAELDLEDYKDLIRSYHVTCTRVIGSHGGSVAQYAGDGVMAYFGYPRAQEDDPERAALAALTALKEVSEIKTNWGGKLTARVGIATGQVLIDGLAYEGVEMIRSAMGEIPNLAARLQSLAEPGTVVVSEPTRRLLGNQFICEDAGRHELKGFRDPVQVYRIREVRTTASRFEARQHGARSHFVNRLEEVTLLRRRWERAGKGQGNMVLLSGEPGIGKSRLARELVDHAAGHKHVRLQFQCSAHHTSSALYPVTAHFEHAARFAPSDSPAEKLHKLRDLLADSPQDLLNLPIFARLLALPVNEETDPLSGASGQKIKEETMNALLMRLIRLAEAKPLLILFEDLHWIDPTSQELLDLFVERIADKPILLICTFRHEFIPPWSGLAHVTSIEVNRLERRESASIVAGLLKAKGQPQAPIDAIVEKTDGVPLFIEELTKAALESAAAAGTGQSKDRAGPLALPSTLKDSLMSRLDRLPLAEKVMPVGAAIGRRFSYRVLAAVTQLDDGVLLPALTQLVDAELLFRRGEPPEATYTFKHALVQDVAYESMLKSRMRELHARIAVTIEESFPAIAENRPEQVAHHYTHAALPDHALLYWERAAGKAIARSANSEAVAHIEAALNENQHEPDPAARIQNEIRLREMLREPIELCGWGSEEIEQNLHRLYELREQQGDRDELFSVINGSCGTHLLAGHLREAEACADQMAVLADETGDPVHEILTAHTKAFLAFLAGRFGEAVEGFDREIATLGPEHAAAMRRHYIADANIVARVMQAWALALSGAEARAEARIVEAERLIEAQEQSFSRIYGLTIIASIRQTRAEAEAARELATAAWQMAHAERVPYWEAWAAVVLGWAMTATGDVDEGLRTLRKGLADYAHTGARQMLPYGRTLLADACLKAGRIREGLSVIEQLEQQDSTNEIRFFDTERRKIAEALRIAAPVGSGGP
jgi:class 3 adenylate cyclase